MCSGFSLRRFLLLWSMGSGALGLLMLGHMGSVVAAPGLQSTSSVVVVLGLSCSERGLFPDQGSNPCLLCWQADSLLLSHQGSPPLTFQALFASQSLVSSHLLTFTEFLVLFCKPHLESIRFLGLCFFLDWILNCLCLLCSCYFYVLLCVTLLLCYFFVCVCVCVCVYVLFLFYLLPANAGDVKDSGSVPVRKIAWRRAKQPTSGFLPGESSWTEEPGGLQSTGLQRINTTEAA